MKPLALTCPFTICWFPPILSSPKFRFRNSSFRVLCSSKPQQVRPETESLSSKLEYKPGIFDDLFLNLFRNKMVQEVGWDSNKPGYDGLIEVANRLMMKNSSNSDTKEAAVRILRSLFPPFLLELFKMLVAPLAEGRVAAIMVARVTAISCQWLMGKCTVNSVDLPDGTSCTSGVLVERCKYLEESKCVGICVNTCKLPSESFFKDYMGVPALMEPNYSDYSCQVKFGVDPPLPEDEAFVKQPCLEICPHASRQRETKSVLNLKTPKHQVTLGSRRDNWNPLIENTAPHKACKR